MKKKLKKFFNNRPWGEWKTRKKTFVLAIFLAIVFTIICQIQLQKGVILSDSLNEGFYSFCKWIAGGSAMLSLFTVAGDIAEKIVGKSSKGEVEEE